MDSIIYERVLCICFCVHLKIGKFDKSFIIILYLVLLVSFLTVWRLFGFSIEVLLGLESWSSRLIGIGVENSSWFLWDSYQSKIRDGLFEFVFLIFIEILPHCQYRNAANLAIGPRFPKIRSKMFLPIEKWTKCHVTSHYSQNPLYMDLNELRFSHRFDWLVLVGTHRKEFNEPIEQTDILTPNAHSKIKIFHFFYILYAQFICLSNASKR